MVGSVSGQRNLFTKKCAEAFLNTVELEQFNDFPKINILECPPAPSTWLYFAECDDDSVMKSDKYRWRSKPKSTEPNTCVCQRFYIACEKKDVILKPVHSEETTNNENQSQRKSKSGPKAADYDSGFRRTVYLLSKEVKKIIQF